VPRSGYVLTHATNITYEQGNAAGSGNVKLLANQKEDRDQIEASHKEMMAKSNTHQERPMIHSGTTEFDPDPRMMPSAEERHEIPNREAAITPVRGLK
jgi:hypothetical protein